MFKLVITPARTNTDPSVFTIKNITSILENEPHNLKVESASMIQNGKGISATVHQTNNTNNTTDSATAASSSSLSSKTIPRIIDLTPNKQQLARIFVNPTQENIHSQQVTHDTIKNAHAFVVGSGGIGVEILKDLFLAGWKKVDLIDLDTIDSTNLNRQFLFRPEDVGKSKSEVASNRILSWSKKTTSSSSSQKHSSTDGNDTTINITAYHGNVKDSKFNKDFYKDRFDVVINGLDNVSARKHVNRVCIEAGVPLVESGTMGYNGQAQPIVRGKYSCYDCQPKSTEQKTFAVCTIHSKPTTIVHCVHYAKELYARLFGEAVGGASEFDFLNEKLGQVNSASSSADAAEQLNLQYARLLGDAIFYEKIQMMIALKKEGSSVGTSSTSTTSASASSNEPKPIHISQLIDEPTTNEIVTDDEKDPEIPQLVNLFATAIQQCRSRDRVPFDKNDDIAVNFIAAVTNLRAHVFNIARKSCFEIRTIAGNIVPAIASTNAGVAASAVHLATQLLMMKTKMQQEQGEGAVDDAYFTGMRSFPTRRKRILLPPTEKHKGANSTFNKSSLWELLNISSFSSGAPNPNCIVCRESTQSALQVRLHAGNHTLGEFVKDFLMKEMSLVSPIINHNDNTIYEHEEYESLSNNSMTQYCNASNNYKCEFDVEDFEQNVEWKVQVIHDEKVVEDLEKQAEHGGSPFVHTVLSRAAAAAAASTSTTNTDAAAEEDNISSMVKSGARAITDDDVILYNPSLKTMKQQQRPREDTNGDEIQQHTSSSKPPRNGAACDTIELE